MGGDILGQHILGHALAALRRIRPWASGAPSIAAMGDLEQAVAAPPRRGRGGRC